MSETRIIAPPVPISPLSGAVVDGSAITFSWSEVKDAEGFCLQVAPDRQFSRDVVEVSAGRATHVVLHNTFSPSDAPRFWRVRADTSAGSSRWSPYGRFYTGTDSAIEAFLKEVQAKEIDQRLDAARMRARREAERALIPYIARDDTIPTASASRVIGLALIASFLLVLATVLLASVI